MSFDRQWLIDLVIKETSNEAFQCDLQTFHLQGVRVWRGFVLLTSHFSIIGIGTIMNCPQSVLPKAALRRKEALPTDSVWRLATMFHLIRSFVLAHECCTFGRLHSSLWLIIVLLASHPLHTCSQLKWWKNRNLAHYVFYHLSSGSVFARLLIKSHCHSHVAKCMCNWS